MSRSEKFANTEITWNMSYEAFRTTLSACGLPIETWGSDGAKSVRSLHDEYLKGKTRLHMLPDRGLVRRVRVAWVDVFGVNQQGQTVRLKEDRQELEDGSVRRRNLVSSLGEKVLRGEANWQAAERALSGELGVRYTTVSFVGYQESFRLSDSYPGLDAYWEDNYFTAFLDQSDFRPEGYVEYQADKTNFHTWVPL